MVLSLGVLGVVDACEHTERDPWLCRVCEVVASVTDRAVVAVRCDLGTYLVVFVQPRVAAIGASGELSEKSAASARE